MSTSASCSSNVSTGSPSQAERQKPQSKNSPVLQEHKRINDHRQQSSEGFGARNRQMKKLSTKIKSMQAAMLFNTLLTTTMASEIGSIVCIPSENMTLLPFIICAFIMIGLFIFNTMLLGINAAFLMNRGHRTKSTDCLDRFSCLFGVMLLVGFLYPIIMMTQEGMHCIPFFWCMYISFALFLIFCTVVFSISFFSHRHMTRTLNDTTTIVLMEVEPLEKKGDSQVREKAAEVTQENTAPSGACGFDSTWKPKSKDDD